MIRGKILSLLKFGAAFAVMIIVFELFCRCSGSGRPAQMIGDEALGVSWRPSSDLICLNEGFRLGRINEYGYIGPAYPPEKSDGVVRIALMGDSYVVGRHLFDRHHFRNILEEKLKEKTTHDIEVLNLGVLAANLERMYLHYEVFGKKFSPDYVVYFVGTHNLNRRKMEMGPRLVLRGDSLRVDYSFRSSKSFEIRKRLHILREFGLYSLIRKAREIHLRGESSKILLGKFSRLFGPEVVEARERSMDQVEDCRRMGINRAILRQLAEMNNRGPTKCIIVCRDGLPKEFVECIKESGITYVDPSTELEKLMESGIDPHYWEGTRSIGHWNHYAHRVVGEFLAEKMQPLIESSAAP